jgi:hypothetical protein
MLPKRQRPLTPANSNTKEKEHHYHPDLVLASSSSSTSSSFSSTSTASPSLQDDDVLLGGFQWLKISSSQKCEDDSSPLVINNRSYHSQGSPLEYLDDDDANLQRQDLALNMNGRSRLRSRSVSPSTFLGIRRRPGRNPATPPRRTAAGSGALYSGGNDDGDYKLKNARDVLEGSILAVINFLKSAGVPKPR